jgi:phage terminase small subunit
MSLTAKQQRFVEEYLCDLNATQAAIRAGYSEKTARFIASENLAKPNVRDAVSAGLKARSEATQVTAEWVVERLVENVGRAMQAEPVFDRGGNPTGEWTFQGSVANKALELLGKHAGMFTDRLHVEGELPVIIVKRGESE